MTDAAAVPEASGTVPASPMITIGHNLAIAGDLADVEISISAKDVPVRTARDLVDFIEDKGIAVLQGNPQPLIQSRNTGKGYAPVRNFFAEPWSEEELAVIEPATTFQEATRVYWKEFGKGKRTRGAIKKKWLALAAKANVARSPGTEPENDLAVRAVETTIDNLIREDPVPPADEVPLEKKPVTAPITVPENPRESPRTGPKKSRGNNFHGGHNWTDPEEVRLVEGAASAQDAWDKHQEKYPGTRTRNAVTSRWYLARSRERNAVPAKKENQEKNKTAKNFEAPPWTDDEREPIRAAISREDALFKYREKFPTSTRSPDAIGRQFYEIHPDKRNPEKPWAEDEKQPILTADTVEEAIAEYQRIFPDSIRTVPAIKREWYELRPEKRGEIPTGRKKGGTNKTPLKGTMREKYQIPFRTTDQPREYNNAVNLCKKYDKPYAEALKLREADEDARLKKKEKKAAAASKVSPRRITVRKQVPKTPEPTVTSKSGYSVGDDVVHNGSKSSPFFGRVGRIDEITVTDKIEHLLLRFGTSSLSISSEFVVPVVRKGAAACPTS